MRSMTVIDVLCGNYRNVTYHTPIQISTNAHVLPQIKRLEVLGLCDDNICSYVVQVFPNLELINLSAMVIRNAITGSLLSTEVAIQFLKYVLRIPTFTVNYIRVKNLERVLMEFYDQKRMIKKLCIQFRQVDEIRSSSEVSVKTYGKGEIHMCISYGKESTKIILSRIGIIEKNGDNFKCNNIDMGFDFDEIRLLDNRGDSDRRKIPFIQKVALSYSLMEGSFLFDMSFHFPIIDRFVIDHCRFDAENNTTCWFVHRGGVNDKCAEYEYEYSLQDTRSLLCFIRCKQAEHVRFYNPKNPLPQSEEKFRKIYQSLSIAF
ncbi:hypothetical protein EDC94DRAFT_663299 [Helicostylum pulchrum]|nr:hypothetical protein EDC94DRAFT_663299 [Helicostylum pulchrum]